MTTRFNGLTTIIRYLCFRTSTSLGRVLAGFNVRQKGSIGPEHSGCVLHSLQNASLLLDRLTFVILHAGLIVIEVLSGIGDEIDVLRTSQPRLVLDTVGDI